jgi:nickel superoxide dismutase
MRLLARLVEPRATAHAHCDLPCGIYDPAQAKIEAESVRAICEKYQQNADPEFRTRALQIKEERSDLVKHHLWVLWTDYFKPPHFEKYPQLNQLFNDAAKMAGPRALGNTTSHRRRPARQIRTSPRSSGRPSKAEHARGTW